MHLLQGPLCATCGCASEEEDGRRAAVRPVSLPFDTGDDGYAVEEIPVPVARAPKVRGFPTYSATSDQPLLGAYEPVSLALHVNGFSFATLEGVEKSVSLSPVSLVRNCRFQSGACAQLKSFKISLLDRDHCCYFAVRSVLEREAEAERSEWVLCISHSIFLITGSLLPRFSVTCDPIPGVWQTRLRLMAGHLIHRDNAGSVSVLFCELQAHDGDSAQLVMYENEHCHAPIMEVRIKDTTPCCDMVGINCSCFVVDCHCFAAQTPSERKLWLRTLSNVKVKLLNRAPPPGDEELRIYRKAIGEHILAVKASLDLSRTSQDALLALGPRKCMQTVGDGDVEPPSAPSLDDFESQGIGTHVKFSL